MNRDIHKLTEVVSVEYGFATSKRCMKRVGAKAADVVSTRYLIYRVSFGLA